LADEGWVFAMPDGRSWHPDVVSRAFERLVVSAGLPKVRFHDLRHAHASHLLAAGVNVKVVSERLGHASVAFTLDVYSHVMPGQQADAAAAVAALVDRL
jgi:integrase